MKRFCFQFLTGLGITTSCAYAIFLFYLSINIFKNLNSSFGLIAVLTFLVGMLMILSSIFLVWFLGQSIMSLKQNKFNNK